MEQLVKKVEEWRVDTELEAEALIEKAKKDPDREGYELSAYSFTRKTKKDEEYFIVKLTKVW